jgi:hypothetical protein
MARKSAKQEDLICISFEDFLNFTYMQIIDYRRFLVAKNPALAVHLSKPLSNREFEEFIFEFDA